MKPSFLLALAALAATPPWTFADNNTLFDPYSSERVVNLRGVWRFSVGDDLQWADPEFDDNDWSKVDAPSEWENEGYRDYDGFAWYRKTFSFPSSKLRGTSFLSLGQIDDVDEVFINGIRIGGGGEFPPHYRTAYDQDRHYLIPPDALRSSGKNVIAVRVFDGGSIGGMRRGPLGIYETELPPLLVDLSGTWLFQPGDNPSWADPATDVSSFTPIRAPGAWEGQGYPELDGFAWYRREFRIDPSTTEGNLVLLLGKIDDLDEVYLNGEKIAGSGDLSSPSLNGSVHYYAQLRGYYFPATKLKERNTLAVRVFDGGRVGGIYEGPLGLITQDAYIRFWEERRDNQSIFKEIRRLFD